MNLIFTAVVLAVLTKSSLSALKWSPDLTGFSTCMNMSVSFESYKNNKCHFLEDEATEDGHDLLECLEGHSKVLNLYIKYSIMKEMRLPYGERTVYCVGKHSIKKQYNKTANVELKLDYKKIIGSLEFTDRSPFRNVGQTNFEVMSGHYDTPVLFNYSPVERKFWYSLRGIPENWLKSLKIYFNPTPGGFPLIKREWLRQLRNLKIEEFEMYNLPIKDVFIFPSLPKLKRLVLQETALSRIDGFHAANKLEELNLSGNNIRELPKIHATNRQHLRILNLSRNNIHFIYEGLGVTSAAAEGRSSTRKPWHRRHDRTKRKARKIRNSVLQSLEEVNLSYNPIQEISFSKQNPIIPALKRLILSYCRIELLPVDVVDPFENIPLLKYLDLSGNSIIYFESTSLFVQRNIELIDLSKNRLTNWPILEFCNVERLDLSENQISNIKNFGLEYTTVKTVDLSGNNITEWNNGDLFYFSNKSQSWIENVNFSNNPISSLSEEMLKSLEGVKTVDLGNNRIDCTQCSIPLLQNWMHLNNEKVLNLGTRKSLVCDSPIEEQGREVLESTFYVTTCEGYKKVYISVSTPVGLIFMLFCFFGFTFYRYRFELVYTMYLFKQRNTNPPDKYEDCIYDAFVCYSGKDRTFVLKTLVPLLEKGNERYKLCLHDRDFLLGSHIVRNIVHSIDKSRKTLLVLSNEFIKSKWCRWETDMANNRLFEDSRNFLVLLQLEPLDRDKIPRHLKVLMATRTYLEWPQHEAEERALRQVRKRLKRALGKSIFQATRQVRSVDEADIML